MALRPGDLNQRVTIQAPNRTPDGAGGEITSWSAGNTVWASVIPVSGGEAFKLGVQNSTQFYKLEIRFRADVTPASRLLWKGIALNIRTCADPDGRREALAITAESGVADG